MNCIICNSKSNFFLKKEFDGVYKEMIPSSEYYKCENCGFTYSKTIFDLNENNFSKLNIVFHQYVEDPTIEKKGNQPPYIEQATMLNVLNANNLISMNEALDFAGGLGALNKIMKKYINSLSFFIYDPFMQDLNSSEYLTKSKLKKYSTVFNSAFFEHITSRKTLEEINDCVSETGVLIIHTVICENIPQDSNWFYINPVHCAFHTNKSMEILMEQWGYKWSLYCPSAKSWVLFKKEYNNEGIVIDEINKMFQTKYIFYNPIGFVDYWKGF